MYHTAYGTAVDDTTAAELIRTSVRENRIVHARTDLAVSAGLSMESEDSVEADGITEYWGVTDDGEPWRVHMDLGQ